MNHNEKAMLDWEGNLKPPKEREVRIVLDDLPVDQLMASALHIGTSEEAVVDASVCITRDAGALSARAEQGNFMMSIGSTTVSKLPVLVYCCHARLP